MPANDDPKAAPNYRALRAIVIILGVLIVLAFLALVWGFITRLGGHSNSGAVSATDRAPDYFMPVGSKIVQIQTNANRVIIAAQTPDGAEVDIFDANDGRLINRIRVKGK
jgi:flagellar basal body-associated protein FliL